MKSSISFLPKTDINKIEVSTHFLFHYPRLTPPQTPSPLAIHTAASSTSISAAMAANPPHHPSSRNNEQALATSNIGLLIHLDCSCTSRVEQRRLLPQQWRFSQYAAATTSLFFFLFTGSYLPFMTIIVAFPSFLYCEPPASRPSSYRLQHQVCSCSNDHYM
ncbi:hypothetical protein OIU85_013914 [Salix viminalis]|uniref:Uncharacterized protein n=1 Tax=Salix viminalis TaxID=40686 RepID=A0A9Q0NMS6_SALVM|nr:hypothetical protein OIU85_013914 [Salix viminalis]